MHFLIFALALALTSFCARADERVSTAALDLRLPKDALAPIPIYIVLTGPPNTLPAVKEYALNILEQIDTEYKSKPTLDSDGRSFCADFTIDTLVALDKNGQLVDIKFKYDSTSPHDLRKEVENSLLNAAKRLSPFPPFPEADRLGTQLVGIPGKMTLRCNKKKRWIRIEAPVQ